MGTENRCVGLSTVATNIKWDIEKDTLSNDLLEEKESCLQNLSFGTLLWINVKVFGISNYSINKNV